ncbi:hypothetical protein H6P81_018275 [Aristolochia fimbriata]|uniref:Uncharacterized protein n=1 Tax=Aristolochia fimbriata TaxID=158543 RepID=A0AAV7E3I5_ARIFI|nr:hypothetical protein H6P81_018275 [Aristolochia fimbriata]
MQLCLYFESHRRLPQGSNQFRNVSEYLRVGPPLYFVVNNNNYSVESRHTNQLRSISQCDANSLLNEISRASLVPVNLHCKACCLMA